MELTRAKELTRDKKELTRDWKELTRAKMKISFANNYFLGNFGQLKIGMDKE